MAYVQPQLPPPLHPFDRIAFAGPMCSGKSTLSKVLRAQGYIAVAFANLLKKTAIELYGPIEKNNEGRKLLQELADDLKKWDPNLFTTHLLRELEDYIEEDRSNAIIRGVPETAKFVLDDLRFQHEFDALKKNGFTIIGVRCDEEVRQARIKELYPDTDPARFQHASEQGWKDMPMDYWIDNTTEMGLQNVQRMLEDAKQPA